jgi:hypothetical protein
MKTKGFSLNILKVFCEQLNKYLSERKILEHMVWRKYASIILLRTLLQFCRLTFEFCIYCGFSSKIIFWWRWKVYP